MRTTEPELSPGHYRGVPPEPEYSRRRTRYANRVVLYSGLRDFVDWADSLRALTVAPSESESVEWTSRFLGRRRFLRKEARAHDGREQIVKLHRVDATVTVKLALQPQLAPYDYTGLEHALEYGVYLVSYEHVDAFGQPSGRELDRKHVVPGLGQSITMTVNAPELWVADEYDPSYDSLDDDFRFRDEPLAKRRPLDDDADFRRVLSTELDDVETLLVDFRKLARQLPDGPDRLIIGDRDLAEELREQLSNIEFETPGDLVTEAPKMGFRSPFTTEIEFGLDVHFGGSGDLREGRATMQAWTAHHGETNAGALSPRRRVAACGQSAHCPNLHPAAAEPD